MDIYNPNCELTLVDRIDMIKKINKKYDLENNAYISFSGGKDSTVLHHLIDMALPGNHIPRVFSNTGIEYLAIVKFVKNLAENDDRFEIITPGKPIITMLQEVGYPFKSKQHSVNVATFQSMGMQSKTASKYVGLTGNKPKNRQCPSKLRYQFEESFTLKISSKCCHELKKQPFKNYSKKSGRNITLTGMRQSEGGLRDNLNCVIVDKEKNLVKFHPLAPVIDEFVDWFIEVEKINLCELYTAPYNFKRTGCAGCPYNIKIQDDLETLKQLLPNEFRKCLKIWEPVYKEYIRLGYRIKTDFYKEI